MKCNRLSKKPLLWSHLFSPKNASLIFIFLRCFLKSALLQVEDASLISSVFYKDASLKVPALPKLGVLQ